MLMILVEGSATVFQRILDLPPGCYQYKFLVDDVWRVDEQQLCIRDSYGMINNVVFVTEQEFLPPVIPAQRFPWNASPSGGTCEPSRQLAESDLSALRYQLSVHLSASKAYDLMPDSGKVIALDVDVAVGQAFDVMFKEGVAVVPLWDEQGTQIMGMLTASDFILILLQLHINNATLTDEEIETHTISAWKDAKFQQNQEAVGVSEALYQRSLIQAGPDDSLKDVALKIVQNKISTVPILNSIEEGSCPQLLSIACLGSILKYIFRHCRRHLDFLPLLQKPVGDLPLGTWAREVGSTIRSCSLLTLRTTDLLSSALNLLIQAEISSVPIVDDSGILVNVYCRSDITSLASGNVYARVQLDQTNISQALEIVDGNNQNRYQTCTRFDSLYRVMELLSEPVVRRVVVIDQQSRRVEGIITLRDVFGFILG